MVRPLIQSMVCAALPRPQAKWHATHHNRPGAIYSGPIVMTERGGSSSTLRQERLTEHLLFGSMTSDSRISASLDAATCPGLQGKTPSAAAYGHDYAFGVRILSRRLKSGRGYT